ncbi:MAG: hypothetical protein NC489_08910 [Ruminococcus flavefaciens]|nr:hypothetical protein [Ruminococcus flavefaciens]
MRDLTTEELQAMKACVFDPMRKFLNETVGSEMGECMFPHVYRDPDPSPRVNWEGMVQDESGEDTGVRIQVWNGSGSVVEVDRCNEIGMMLNELYRQKHAAGETITSEDIHKCIKAGCIQNIKSPMTATRLVEMTNLMARALAAPTKPSDSTDDPGADMTRYLESRKACQCSEDLQTATTKERFCQLLKDNYDVIPEKFYDYLWEALHPNLNETEQ